MLSTNKYIILSFVIVIAISSISSALEYSSYIFTTRDVIFFSYENGTQVQVYSSMGQLLWPNGPDVILAKGQHAMAGFDNTNQVYKVCGSKKFAVLTGDPATNGVSGYYAMDANGLGTCKELYTYVPASYPEYYGHQLFIVFAYQDNTQVTVQQDVGKIVIEYCPDKSCIELKSLKFYMQSYRNKGIFYEALTNDILDDLVSVCRPRWMKVTSRFRPRGGITTDVVAEYKTDK